MSGAAAENCAILPQVGAVLHYNSALVDEDRDEGSPKWAIDGSCALIRSNTVLTIHHAVAKPGHKAVFFPGTGIFHISNLVSERETKKNRRFLPFGDYMVLGELHGGDAGGLEPLDVHKIRKYQKSGTYLQVSSFGSLFDGVAGQPDGVQRTVMVTSGQPSNLHYDNLDLNWWAPWNGDQAVGPNSSGGPVLWNTNGCSSAVGVVRERKGHQQMSSWIGRERYRWLTDDLPTSAAPVGRAVLDACNADLRRDQPFVRRVGYVGGDARWTVSAGAHVRLQAHVFDREPTAEDLRAVPLDRSRRGRFITRTVSAEPTDAPAWLAVVRTDVGDGVPAVPIQCVLGAAA